MIRILAGLTILTCGANFGQTPPVASFEVVSIKPGSAEQMKGSSGIATGHGMVLGHNVSLKRCIIGAFGVQARQILGGTQWLDSDRFEIVAKAGTPENHSG